MKRLIIALAFGLAALAVQTAHAQITNGNFTTNLSGWLTVGDVEHDTASSFGGVGGNSAAVFSNDVNFLATSMPSIRRTLGDTDSNFLNGPELPGWGATSIDGVNNPAPLYWASHGVTSGSSVLGSAIYQNFTGGAGGNTVVFDWNFATTERQVGSPPPNLYDDFAFVSIQNVTAGTAPVVYRLADATVDELVLNGPTAYAFTPGNSSMTGYYTGSIILPAGSASDSYRVAFGATEVNAVSGLTSLSVDSVRLITNQEMATVPNPVDFGNVRYTNGGTNAATADVTIANIGANPSTLSSILATAPSGSLEMSGGGAQPDLVRNSDTVPTENVTYSFAPTNRGAEAGQVTITSDGSTNSSDTIDLSGVGVGPTYNDNNVPNTLGFGSISSGSSNSTLSLENDTGDGNLGNALTGLTILSATITGANASDFTFQFNGTQSWLPGSILQPDDASAFGITINFTPSLFDDTFRNAILTINTDQGAILGGNGDDFVYDLAGFADFQQQGGGGVGAPEPGSIALWTIVGLVGAVTARKFGKRKPKAA